MSSCKQTPGTLHGVPCGRSRAVASLAVLALAVAGCNVDGSSSRSHPRTSPTLHNGKLPATPRATVASSQAQVQANVAAHATDVSVDTRVTLRVQHGVLHRVVLTAPLQTGRLPGRFNADHTRWTAKERLEPGTRYVVFGSAADAGGVATSKRIAFQTEDLTLDQQTYARITPAQDEVVGVGMPVFVHFDVPVSDHAKFERRMHVTASPATKGSWSWVSDTEVHWRPRTYWQPGTSVSVDLQVNGLAAGNGIYGQMDRSVDFRVGRSVVMQADLRVDKMKVLVDGKLARTIPITGGKPGFETRSGTKLIVEKIRSKRMDAATVGIKKKDPEYYNIAKVEYAQRVTYTGEFVHAAPWSEDAHGKANVSHGCVGMSTKNAAWLYSLTLPGAPIEVTGTHRALEPGNGWTDWNVSFADYRRGSAL